MRRQHISAAHIKETTYMQKIRHLFILCGIVVTLFPVYALFVGSTHTLSEISAAPMSLLPGRELIANYVAVFFQSEALLGAKISLLLMNSGIMAVSIAVGKILLSMLASFAIVFFRFPLRRLCFWAIYITLMLPIEVRILPSYKIIADLNLLNTYVGLTVPLMVSATAVFFLRQFFLMIPGELVEAAKIDGANPMQFFIRILLPMSSTIIAALFVVQFIFGWNQYLWPLLVTSEPRFYNLLIGINRLTYGADTWVFWNIIMAVTLVSIIIPGIVIYLMQKQFIQGIIVSEK